MTAVEWLFERLDISQGYESAIEVLEQAKAMEKEQSIAFFKAGQESMEEGGKGFQQYYNETCKSE